MSLAIKYHMKRRRSLEKGVHNELAGMKGQSLQGERVRSGVEPDGAKRASKAVLDELRAMPKPKLLAGGGEPKEEPYFIEETKRKHGGFPDKMGPTGPTGYRNRNKNSDLDHGQKRGPEGYPKYQEQAQNERGVNRPVSGVTGFPGAKGTSRAGDYTKERYGDEPLFKGKGHPAIKEHKQVLKEMTKIKGPTSGKSGFAEGGDVCMHCGGYARGGSVEDAHEKQVGVNMPVYTGRYGAGTSGAGLEVRGKRSPNARGMNKETLEDLKSMKGPTKGRSGFAEGGEALADFDSADFDAGGFEGTEADYSGDNSGDHLSDEGEEQRRKSALMSYLRRKTG